MDIDKHFETNKALETEGVWHDVADGGRVKIARTGNPKYRKALRARTKGREYQLQRGIMSDDLSEKLLCEVISETILLDWQNFTSGGEKLPYSQKAAADLLQRLPDFRNMVVALAGDMEAYRNDEQEQAAGNSPTSSASTSKTGGKT